MRPDSPHQLVGPDSPHQLVGPDSPNQLVGQIHRTNWWVRFTTPTGGVRFTTTGGVRFTTPTGGARFTTPTGGARCITPTVIGKFVDIPPTHFNVKFADHTRETIYILNHPYLGDNPLMFGQRLQIFSSTDYKFPRDDMRNLFTDKAGTTDRPIVLFVISLV